MPEGHVILRAAATLDRWLAGREVTAARTQVHGLPAHKLVGQTVDAVEAKGKHLLIRFSSGMVLHSHMKMTGSWHVYFAGQKWQRPASQARFVLETGDRIAVCFNAPVVELLAANGEAQHPGLVNLGPDVLKPPVDLAEVRRRAATTPPKTTVGELLLDQSVVSGIGNIFRCESLFLQRLDPFTPRVDLGDEQLDALVGVASEVMLESVRTGHMADSWVYGRSRRPCRRCGTRIESRALGSPLPRTVYWCPRCQVRPTP